MAVWLDRWDVLSECTAGKFVRLHSAVINKDAKLSDDTVGI